MNKKSRKVVVVGGAGFIGSHLTDALVEEGYDVHVIDNLSAGKKEHVNKKAKLHVKDMRNLEGIKPIIKGAEYVFHLAALPRVPRSIDFPMESHDVNVNGIVNVLIASKEGGVKKFVYSASSSAYGDQKIIPLHEEMLANPMSPYGLYKFVGELYCRVWNIVYGLPTVSLRYFSVYGPRLDPEGAYALVIGKFLKQKKEGKPLTITGDGKQTRDFTHVSDIVRANILAAKSKKVGKGEVVNVGAGKNKSIKEVAKLIGGKVLHVPPRFEPKHTKADNRKSKKMLGWTPKVSIEKGIAELRKIWGV